MSEVDQTKRVMKVYLVEVRLKRLGWVLGGKEFHKEGNVVYGFRKG